MENWQQVHDRYNQWWADYPDMCRRHAYQVLCLLGECHKLDENMWQQYLQRYTNIQHYVAEQVKVTRQKDEENLFRRMTYRNEAEMKAVLG